MPTIEHALDHKIRRLAAWATTTGGSVTTIELHGLGWTPTQIREAVRYGLLIRRRRGHYLVGHASLSREGAWNSLVRQAGEGAFLGGESAIEHWGYLPWRSRSVEVVVPRHRRQVNGALVRVRPKLIELGASSHRGIPILSPECALVLHAERTSSSQVVRLIREGRYTRRLDLDLLARLADERYLRGAGTIREALALWYTGDTGMRSRYERLVNRVLPDDVKLGSLRNATIQVGTERLVVDRVWREYGICLEIDGAPHDEPDQQRIDRIFGAALTADDWDLHRAHWRDLDRDPRAALQPLIRAVRAAHAARSSRTTRRNFLHEMGG